MSRAATSSGGNIGVCLFYGPTPTNSTCNLHIFPARQPPHSHEGPSYGDATMLGANNPLASIHSPTRRGPSFTGLPSLRMPEPCPPWVNTWSSAGRSATATGRRPAKMTQVRRAIREKTRRPGAPAVLTPEKADRYGKEHQNRSGRESDRAKLAYEGACFGGHGSHGGSGHLGGHLQSPDPKRMVTKKFAGFWAGSTRQCPARKESDPIGAGPDFAPDSLHL